MLNAAEDAAITSVPRLLIADWIMMFADENTIACMAAGIPILRILPRIDLLTRSFLTSNLAAVSVCLKKCSKMMLLKRFEITVAAATPSTVRPRIITKNIFRSTLTMPEIMSATKGILVLPNPLKTAASKL